MEDCILKRGDIFFSTSEGFMSKAIRRLTRSWGESRTMVSHTGIVVNDGPFEHALIVEAVRGVKLNNIVECYDKPDSYVSIYRPIGLSDNELTSLVDSASGFIGNKYGYVKLLAHMGDWFLQGAYFFRRLARMKDYPICSWIVAYCYQQIGRDFGVDCKGAAPDDIWDYVNENPEQYQSIRRFTQITCWEPSQQ